MNDRVIYREVQHESNTAMTTCQQRQKTNYFRNSRISIEILKTAVGTKDGILEEHHYHVHGSPKNSRDSKLKKGLIC